MKNVTFDSLLTLVLEDTDDEGYDQTNQSDKRLLTFIKERRAGAAKIASQAVRKPGTSRLTAKHFKAKDPIYAKAEKLVKQGKGLKQLKSEYLNTLKHLRKNNRQPMKFQELTGKLEVLGELLIEAKLM